MFKWLKKIFIPHEHNDFKPHLFREFGVLVLFSIIILAFIVPIVGQTILIRTNLIALVLPNVLVDYANENRSTENFNHLAVNSTLEKAAQLKANDMATKGYFAHKSPEGRSPWYFFQQAGYDFSFAGENLAVNFNDSVDVSRAWMNSPGHRANIMNGNFSEIGIATAEGMYQGRKTVFVVQLFGRPAVKTPSPVVSVKTPIKIPQPSTQTTKVTVTTPTTTSVLSESVSNEIFGENGNNELFISVERKSADYSSTTTKYSSFVERIMVSPGKVLSYTYLFIAFVMIVSLLLTVFIEIKRQHSRHIFLAVGLLIIIFGLLYIYRFILFPPLLII